MRDNTRTLHFNPDEENLQFVTDFLQTFGTVKTNYLTGIVNPILVFFLF